MKKLILTFVAMLILTPFCSAGEYSVVIAGVFKDFRARKIADTAHKNQIVRKTADVAPPSVFFYPQTFPRIRAFSFRIRCLGGKCR